MIYPARVDRWLAALLGGAILLELVVGGLNLNAALTTGRPTVPVAVGVCAACAAGAVLLGLILRGCYKIRYEVTSTELVVRYWPFRTRVPLQAIVEVVPTSNPLSAPAPAPEDRGGPAAPQSARAGRLSRGFAIKPGPEKSLRSRRTQLLPSLALRACGPALPSPLGGRGRALWPDERTDPVENSGA